MHSSPITLEALFVLDAIDRRGSFAGAAEQLNKVPSALSYIVQKLEEQLSVTLFVRQGRRSVLTPAGRHLLEEGRKVLGAVSQITERTQTIAHGWEPKIRIAIDSILENQNVFDVIAAFIALHPSIEVDVREEVMNGTWEALIEHEVDLVIGAPSPVPNQQGIRAVTMASIENVLVVHPNHPLTLADQPVSKQALRQHRTVVVHDSAKSAIPWSANFIEDSHHCFVSSVSQKINALVAGVGVGFLPRDRVVSLINEGKLVELTFADTLSPINLCMAWKMVNKGKGLKQLTLMLEQAFAYHT